MDYTLTDDGKGKSTPVRVLFHLHYLSRLLNRFLLSLSRKEYLRLLFSTSLMVSKHFSACDLIFANLFFDFVAYIINEVYNIFII